jgi:hypothetical protein
MTSDTDPLTESVGIQPYPSSLMVKDKERCGCGGGGFQDADYNHTLQQLK